MSTSGPPGGPYPAGEPQDPWPGGGRYDPYSNPSDPYGIAAAWGRSPEQDDEQPTAAYSQPPTPPYGQQQPSPYGQQHDQPQQPEYLQQPPFLAPPAPYGEPPAPYGAPPAPYGEPAFHSRPVASDQPTEQFQPAQQFESAQQFQPAQQFESTQQFQPAQQFESTQQFQPAQESKPPLYSQRSGPTAEDAWGNPAAPERPRARRSRLVVAMVAGLVVVLGGAVGTGVYLASHQDTSRNTFRGTPAAQPVPASASPQAQGTPSAGASDNTDVGNDAIIAQPGDCLINDGTNEAPKLRKVTCAKDTYEVLKRFPATIDKKKCDGVPGYTHNYFFDSSVDSEDFVLCLKQRK